MKCVLKKKKKEIFKHDELTIFENLWVDSILLACHLGVPSNISRLKSAAVVFFAGLASKRGSVVANRGLGPRRPGRAGSTGIPSNPLRRRRITRQPRRRRSSRLCPAGSSRSVDPILPGPRLLAETHQNDTFSLSFDLPRFLSPAFQFSH